MSISATSLHRHWETGRRWKKYRSPGALSGFPLPMLWCAHATCSCIRCKWGPRVIWDTSSFPVSGGKCQFRKKKCGHSCAETALQGATEGTTQKWANEANKWPLALNRVLAMQELSRPNWLGANGAAKSASGKATLISFLRSRDAFVLFESAQTYHAWMVPELHCEGSSDMETGSECAQVTWTESPWRNLAPRRSCYKISCGRWQDRGFKGCRGHSRYTKESRGFLAELFKLGNKTDLTWEENFQGHVQDNGKGKLFQCFCTKIVLSKRLFCLSGHRLPTSQSDTGKVWCHFTCWMHHGTFVPAGSEESECASVLSNKKKQQRNKNFWAKTHWVQLHISIFLNTIFPNSRQICIERTTWQSVGHDKKSINPLLIGQATSRVVRAWVNSVPCLTSSGVLGSQRKSCRRLNKWLCHKWSFVRCRFVLVFVAFLIRWPSQC